MRDSDRRGRISQLSQVVLLLASTQAGWACTGHISEDALEDSAAPAQMAGGVAQSPAPAQSPPGNTPIAQSSSGTLAMGNVTAPATVKFSQVFNEVFGGCAGFCHRGSGLGMLSLSLEDDAYSALVDQDARGTELPMGAARACADSGVKRVVPGNAEASLLYLKLAGRHACGTAMPPPDTGAPAIPGDKLELVKRWIDGGALPGDGPTGTAPGMSGPIEPPAMPAAPTMIEWPSFGPDENHTRNNPAERMIGKTNVASLKTLWMKNLSGGMNGIPALVSGVLYFTDYAALYAVNPKTGGNLWTARVGESQSSPLVTADAIYVSGGRSLFAFDKMGKPKWTTPLNDHPNTTIISAPVLAGNVIVIGVAGNELAIAKTDYTFVGYVKGVNKDTGAIVWTRPVSGAEVAIEGQSAKAGNGVSVWSSAVIDPERKLAFIGTGNSYEKPASDLSDALVAINYETGELVWHNQFSKDDVYVSAACPSRNCEEDFDIGASPNLLSIGEVPAVTVGSKGGIFKAINRETGATIWERELWMETGRGAAGGIMTTAAIGENLIYTNSNKWMAHGFRRTGNHDPSDTSISFALDKASGAIVWQRALMRPAIGMALLANGVVYQALIDGSVYGLDAESGAVLWEGQNLGHDLAPGFNLTDGVLYGGSGGTWWVQGPRPGANIVAYALP